MNNTPGYESLSKRIEHVVQLRDQLMSEDDFASRLQASSLDSHLSDLRAQVLQDFTEGEREVLELRLAGKSVDSGAAPTELLSKLLNHITSTLHRASHKITSGRDSQKVPIRLKELLDLRFASIQPGSSKLLVTASSAGDLLGNPARDTFDEFFKLLNSFQEEEEFIEHVSCVGYKSLNSFNALANDIANAGLSLKISWPDSKNGYKYWEATSDDFKLIKSRIRSIDIRRIDTERLIGRVSLLSEDGKLNIRLYNNTEIKAKFPPELLPEVKEVCRLGREITGTFQVTTVGNSELGVERKTYLLSKLLQSNLVE